LAWMLAKGSCVIPIPGSSRAETARASAAGRPPVLLDYLALADPDTFADIGSEHRGIALLLVAARVGTTRLIDNARVQIGAGTEEPDGGQP
ncbi:MAG: pantoate--beta-alanine ligase, partial [Streptosporangiaceae bacterium]